MAPELGSMLSFFSLFIWNMFGIMHNLKLIGIYHRIPPNGCIKKLSLYCTGADHNTLHYVGRNSTFYGLRVWKEAHDG
jgi:hypothetical protein